MVLRLQLERMKSGLLPSLREYARIFGITRPSCCGCAGRPVVMHPGPMNRGVEIEPEVADGPDSVILDQVPTGWRCAWRCSSWSGAGRRSRPSAPEREPAGREAR